MSTDPYPEVSVDESGIVPPQGGRSQEWPKKIRTLTATELDRLTIDSGGRFYWDGRLVNYEPPQPKEPAEKPSDTRDHTDHDLGDHNGPESIEDAEPQQPVDTRFDRARHDEPPAVDLDRVRPAESVPEMAAERVVPHVIGGSDRLRLKLSRWQSIGAVIVVLGVIVGASGMAAYGLVAAHEWGCRTGLIQSYCPASMPGRPAQRSDIPA